jgi:uncharacterized protein YuzE
VEIFYSNAHDLLYLRFDPRQQEIRNEDLAEDVVMDLGDSDRIVGIEILDASRRLDLGSLLPVAFRPGLPGDRSAAR